MSAISCECADNQVALSTFNIQHSTFNIQHSTFNFNAQYLMKNSKMLHTLLLTAALSFIGAGLASAAIINIMPSKDNTLYVYDPAEGDHSNGAGFHLFAGKTARGELR